VRFFEPGFASLLLFTLYCILISLYRYPSMEPVLSEVEVLGMTRKRLLI